MTEAELYERLRNHFRDNDFTWTLDNGEVILPDEDDFEKFLDEAIRHLYTEDVGARLTVGHLIIEKRENTYDVFAYFGEIR